MVSFAVITSLPLLRSCRSSVGHICLHTFVLVNFQGMCSPLQLHRDPVVCNWFPFFPSPLTFLGRKDPIACTLLVQAVCIIFFMLLLTSMWCKAFLCCLGWSLQVGFTISLLKMWSWGGGSQLLFAVCGASRKQGQSTAFSCTCCPLAMNCYIVGDTFSFLFSPQLNWE